MILKLRLVNLGLFKYSKPIVRFVVRDFTYDEKKIEESRNELSKLESDKKRQFVSRFIFVINTALWNFCHINVSFLKSVNFSVLNVLSHMHFFKRHPTSTSWNIIPNIEDR